MKNYANDGAPDIYIFTISTIRVRVSFPFCEVFIPMFPFQQALELKYGVGSEKVLVATKLVQSTIQKVYKYCFKKILINKIFLGD